MNALTNSLAKYDETIESNNNSVKLFFLKGYPFYLPGALLILVLFFCLAFTSTSRVLKNCGLWISSKNKRNLSLIYSCVFFSVCGSVASLYFCIASLVIFVNVVPNNEVWSSHTLQITISSGLMVTDMFFLVNCLLLVHFISKSYDLADSLRSCLFYAFCFSFLLLSFASGLYFSFAVEIAGSCIFQPKLTIDLYSSDQLCPIQVRNTFIVSFLCVFLMLINCFYLFLLTPFRDPYYYFELHDGEPLAYDIIATEQTNLLRSVVDEERFLNNIARYQSPKSRSLSKKSTDSTSLPVFNNTETYQNKGKIYYTYGDKGDDKSDDKNISNTSNSNSNNSTNCIDGLDSNFTYNRNSSSIDTFNGNENNGTVKTNITPVPKPRPAETFKKLNKSKNNIENQTTYVSKTSGKNDCSPLYRRNTSPSVYAKEQDLSFLVKETQPLEYSNPQNGVKSRSYSFNNNGKQKPVCVRKSDVDVTTTAKKRSNSVGNYRYMKRNDQQSFNTAIPEEHEDDYTHKPKFGIEVDGGVVKNELKEYLDLMKKQREQF